MEKDFITNPPAPQRRIILKNRIDEIHKLAVIVEQFFQENNIPSELLFKMNLVFEEIISNIINYGYEDGGDHDIKVFLALINGELVVEITDGGKAFDPLANPEPRLDIPLEERPIGGLGIYLVKHLVDEIRYKREGNSNILSFRKKIHDKE